MLRLRLGSRWNFEGDSMRHVHLFRSLVTALTVSMLWLVVGSSASAGTPPVYFVDESKLPFTTLPEATAY